jgi:folate-dependent phosphoribosylglycinamide formyltransferase PurN
MLTLGLLASHRGSNVQAVVEACRSGRFAAQPGVVISNNASSGALAFARSAGIPALRIGGPEYADDVVRELAQSRVPVLPGDTVAQLAARGLTREHAFIVETLSAIAAGAIQLAELPVESSAGDRADL